MFKKEKLLIAGVTGNGYKTKDIWDEFKDIEEKNPIDSITPGSYYEIRIHKENECLCHVGISVNEKVNNKAYKIMELPASLYKSFDVYVPNGYDSENENMGKWLSENKEKYMEREINGDKYIIEHYTERFDKENIVEIWIPLIEL